MAPSRRLITRSRKRPARNIALSDADAVGKEHQVTHSPLGRLRAVCIVAEPQRAVCKHVRMPHTPGRVWTSQGASACGS
jgi:hypothetical protein